LSTVCGCSVVSLSVLASSLVQDAMNEIDTKLAKASKINTIDFFIMFTFLVIQIFATTPVSRRC
jgi:hypothetical protein